MQGKDAPEGFRRPQQERSRQTLRRIADATETLLERHGPAGVTVHDVIAAAGTSVGSFYARFDSRDAAVAYVQDRHWTEVRSMWGQFLDSERWKDVPAGRVIAEVVRRYVRVVLGDRRLVRAFLRELLEHEDGTCLEWIRSMDDEVAGLMRRLIEERSSELSHPNPGEAAEQGFRIVLSAVRDYVLFGDSGLEGERTRERQLILDLALMYGGLLGVSDRPATYRQLLALCRGRDA
jgi:AcrR family transcriptional regulator